MKNDNKRKIKSTTDKQESTTKSDKTDSFSILNWITLALITVVIGYVIFTGVRYFYSHYDKKPHHHHIQ